MRRLKRLEVKMLESPDGQLSLTEPDSRSMTSRGSGIDGYNVQTAVDTRHHLIVAHEVTNVGSDRQQLFNMAEKAKAVTGAKKLEAVADRGYFRGQELLACEQAQITTYLPKPQTSGNMSKGLFGKRDFIYKHAEDEYQCPAGHQLVYRFTRQEGGQMIRRYWSSACPQCSLKSQCTTGLNRLVSCWEHEAVNEAAERRLDKAPECMRIRGSTVEHPFGTLKSWMGHTHFLTRTLPRVSTEMSLHILVYNMKRVMTILGTKPLIEAIRA